jgi:aspartate racemase
MIDEVCKEARNNKLKSCGLIGTKFTMNATFYQQVFNRFNINIIVPDPKDIEIINHRLFTELELGIFKESTRDELLAVIRKMKESHNIDSLILGCTEFPLMFTECSYMGIPFLNTTRIHVKSIVQKCLE